MDRNSAKKNAERSPRDDSGQTTTEYLMIAAAALAVIVGGLLAFGSQLSVKAGEIVGELFK